MEEQQTIKKKIKKSFAEFGRAGTDLLYKYGLSDRENPDKLISKKGMDYIDTKVERDTHYTSCIATRRQKLIKKGWRILPGGKTKRDEKIADFVKYQIDHMTGQFDSDIEGMLDKISKGFSLTEINYYPIKSGKYQGKIGLKSLRLKPAKYFSFKFDDFGYWVINQIDPISQKAEMPIEKFIHIINGANDENPYGDSYGAKCAIWVWLKENEAKFWAIYSERFGMPLIKVTTPTNITDTDKTKIDEILEAALKDTGIRIPKGFEIEFMEALRRGDVYYDNFIERCNKEISKILLGQTLSSEEGKRGQGSYALGQTHAQTMEDYIAFDAVDISNGINKQLIPKIVDYNYITDRYPQFEFIGIDIAALISISQTLNNLVNAGMKIPTKWAHQATGIPEAKQDEQILEKITTMPISPISGIDNRSNMDEGITAEQFKELEDYEKIFENYKNKGISIWDKFKNLFKKEVKKKH